MRVQRSSNASFSNLCHFLRHPPYSQVITRQLICGRRISMVNTRLARQFISTTNYLFFSNVNGPSFNHRGGFVTKRTTFNSNVARTLFIVVDLHHVCRPVAYTSNVRCTALTLFKQCLGCAVSWCQRFSTIIRFCDLRVVLFWKLVFCLDGINTLRVRDLFYFFHGINIYPTPSRRIRDNLIFGVSSRRRDVKAPRRTTYPACHSIFGGHFFLFRNARFDRLLFCRIVKGSFLSISSRCVAWRVFHFLVHGGWGLSCELLPGSCTLFTTKRPGTSILPRDPFPAASPVFFRPGCFPDT